MVFIQSGKAFDRDTFFLCKGDGLNYNNVTTIGKAIAWLWNFQGGSYASSPDSAPATVFYNAAGKFLTTIKTTFQGGGDSFDQVWVVVKDWPIPSFPFPTDTSYCVGSSISLLLNTISYPGVDYTWSTGEKTPAISVNSKGTYWVTLVLTSDFGNCDSVYKEVIVSENPLPIVKLGPDKLMCQNQSLILDAGPGTGYTYLWTPGNDITRTLNVSLPGVYQVKVTNSFGCSATDDIELVDSCPHLIFVPNAVSPNEDRLNDLFVKVWNFTPKEYLFSVYDRWGELLFETSDMKAGWDCKVNNFLVQQDIYVYKIVYKDTDKKWYAFRGTFYVVR